VSAAALDDGYVQKAFCRSFVEYSFAMMKPT